MTIRKYEQQKRTISGVIIGSKTIDSIEIYSICDRAFEQINNRSYSASFIRNVYETVMPKKGNTPDKNVYEHKGIRVVINNQEGFIITVIRLSKNTRRLKQT